MTMFTPNIELWADDLGSCDKLTRRKVLLGMKYSLGRKLEPRRKC